MVAIRAKLEKMQAVAKRAEEVNTSLREVMTENDPVLVLVRARNRQITN